MDDQNHINVKKIFSFSKEAQAALGFMVLQFVFKISVEMEGGKLIQGIPIIPIVLFILPMLIITIILCLFKQRSALILGMFYGLLHTPLILLLVLFNKLPQGYLKPLNVEFATLFIAYFCFLEYRRTRKSNKDVPFYNPFMFFQYVAISGLFLMAVAFFTDIIINPKLSNGLNNSSFIPIIQAFTVLSLIVIAILILLNLLRKEWSYLITGIYGILSIFTLSIICILFKTFMIGLILGIPIAAALIVFSFLVNRNSKQKS